MSARLKFWGGVRVGGQAWGDNSIQFIIIGRVGDKSFKELRRKIGGGGGGVGRVGDNNILTVLCHWLDKKCHFKKTALWPFFSSRIC